MVKIIKKTRPLTSHESLEKKIQLEPYRPVSGGINDIIKGSLLAGVAGLFSYKFMDEFIIHKTDSLMVYLMTSGLFFTTYIGVMKTIRGCERIVNWMIDYRKPQSNETEIYSTPYGYTTKGHDSDLKGSERIMPIEDVIEIGHKTSGKIVMLNGVVFHEVESRVDYQITVTGTGIYRGKEIIVYQTNPTNGAGVESINYSTAESMKESFKIGVPLQIEGTVCQKGIKDGHLVWEIEMKRAQQAYIDEDNKRALEDEIRDFLLAHMGTLDELLVENLTTYLYNRSVFKSSGIIIDDSGFTASNVVLVPGKDLAIKPDIPRRLKKEFQFYQAVKGTPFQMFCPELSDEAQPYKEYEGHALLALRNVWNSPSGIIKANLAYDEQLRKMGINQFVDEKDPMYNLFLMAVMHASAATFPESIKQGFGMSPYVDLNNRPHHESFMEPGKNTDGETLRIQQDLAKIIAEAQPYVNEYNALLEELHNQGRLAIIDGDWKQGNIINGHKLDYSCIGLGLELDDIAYNRSQESEGPSLDRYFLSIEDYNQYRTEVDGNFRERIAEMQGLLSPGRTATLAWLRQCVLREAVMKKRDLSVKEYVKQAECYSSLIYEALDALKGRR